MHTYSPEPIWLPLRPSRYLRRYLLLLHALAVLSLLMLQLPWVLRLSSVGLTAVSLGWYWRRHVWLYGAGAIRCLHWRADGDCWLTDGEGRVTVYREVKAGLLQPALTVLRLSGGNAPRWVALPADCAERQTLRRLRVRLRRQSAETDQSSPLRGT